MDVGRKQNNELERGKNMKAINEILAGKTNPRNRKAVAKRLDGMSRRQLKAIHEAVTGAKVFGLVTDIREAVREALLEG